MGERWALAIIVLLLVLAPALAHKRPVIEYTYVSHIWEEAYETIPKQPVVDEDILFRLSVEHPNDTIDGNVTVQFALYTDNTEYSWYNGKSYKEPDWIVIQDGYLTPVDEHTFEANTIIGEPGSYNVFVDWYEDGQYIGQSMHTLDVETRTIGPMWIAFLVLMVLGTIVGVRSGVLV